MAGEQQRHDINDKAREGIRLYSIGEKGTHSGNAVHVKTGKLLG